MGTASFNDTECYPDGPLPTELLADTLGHQPAVIAAYPMPGETRQAPETVGES